MDKAPDSAPADGAAGSGEKAAPNPPAEGQQGVAVLGKALSIHIGQPLPELDKGRVKAYTVTSDTRKDIGNLFALVCEPDLTPRHKKTNVYESIINPNVANLIKHGVVYWPPAQQERYVFIYMNNLGKRLAEPGDVQALGIKPEIVTEKILKPLINVLHDFRDRDFVHGSISPANIFDGGSVSFENIRLGDGLTTPPFIPNPLYETIERGLADPIARGLGNWATDIYSLGATVAALIRSHDPTYGLSREDVVKMKMDIGSFATIAGKDRFSGSILDFLRGTLHDDPSQRWGVEEMLGWLDGQRLTPKQIAKKYKATRPFAFNSKKYLYPAHLAIDLSKNPSEARRMVEDGGLEHWLTRSIEKNKIFERVQDAVEKSREIGQDKEYEERLVSNLSIALNPDAPVEYRGYRMFPDGVGSLLVEAYVKNKDLSIFHDLISYGIVMNWVKLQDNASADIGSYLAKFDTARYFLRQDKIGFGLERCLYALNPDARCLSPKLMGYFVLSAEDMIKAFEDLCSRRKAPGMFLDRHCVAFLLSRDANIIEPFIIDVRAEEHHRNLLAQLRCFAAIQKRHKIESLPYLAETFMGMLPVLYKRVHDSRRRDRIKENVVKYAKAGDLVRMADVLANTEVIAKDLAEFKQAMREYIELSGELAKLESRLQDKEGFGKVMGRETSALVSSVLAGISMLLIAFLYLTHNPLF